ncbi:sugar phosphate isomerase/epimerase family protein [Paraclostridium bifermentans]|uniref:sugar phosphate isomerase/epimerase family protein n=1 Tax=Paraclostridium bifermentans TaxID=1490 RepID=UPI0004690135|nr:sugar phosphate isomerase/epimerase family protein [Paraclostridium bifermentans]
MKDIKLVKLIGDINKSNIDEINNLGIGLEIQSFPQNILDEDYSTIISDCKNKLKNFSNVISLHGSSFDLNPGSTDKKVIELTKYRYMQSVEIAKEIGAKYVIFHSQLNPLLSVEKIRKLKLDNQIKFWKDFMNEIDDIDVTILLENEYDENPEEILHIVKSVNYPKLRICLDTGHILAYSKTSLEEWIVSTKDFITYIHLHFNDGKNDSHSKPSNEQLIYFKNIIEEAEINPILSLEYIFENEVEEINRVRHALS